MQDGIGFAEAIEFGAAFDFKAFVEIKTDCLLILFVDIEANCAKFLNSIVKQAFSDAFAAPIGMNEEHFYHITT